MIRGAHKNHPLGFKTAPFGRCWYKDPLGVFFSNSVYVISPVWGFMKHLTNILQMGWFNHHLDLGWWWWWWWWWSKNGLKPPVVYSILPISWPLRRRIASLPQIVACGGLPRLVVRLAAEVPGWKHSIYWIYICESLFSHVVVIDFDVRWTISVYQCISYINMACLTV